LNLFGTVQGGYLAVLIDEMFSTVIASVLEVEEWAMTAEFKINFLRALNPQFLAIWRSRYCWVSCRTSCRTASDYRCLGSRELLPKVVDLMRA
jgi:hypothetical protein